MVMAECASTSRPNDGHPAGLDDTCHFVKFLGSLKLGPATKNKRPCQRMGFLTTLGIVFLPGVVPI